MTTTESTHAATGIVGLDDILGGGFSRNRLFLLEGVPGSGKTTLALQFLMNGRDGGETVVYVTLSETEAELRSVAKSHGWDLDGIHIHELSPTDNDLEPEQQTTIFHSSEVELVVTVRRVLDDIERLKPTRVVFDSLSELRLLAGNPLRYRRQILALKQFLSSRQCTVLLLDDLTATDRDPQMQSIAHGVVLLEQIQPEYGAQRRRLRVLKYRGMQFRGGYHDYSIQQGGLRVFPRLVAAEHRQTLSRASIPSGVAALDQLLGGGLEEGTSTLIVGPAGTGKSTLAAQFVCALASRGGRAAMFIFDESPQTLLSRCDALHVKLREPVETGQVQIQQVDPAEMSPGELTHNIREAVDNGARMIVIDSLNGYLNAMPEEHFLTVQLHELLMYLGQHGVATLLIGANHGIIGTNMTTPVDASYLADAIVLLRYFELRGEVRQAVSVVKKRGGAHERSIRQFSLDGGIQIGEALRAFRGILTGVPVYEGEDAAQ